MWLNNKSRLIQSHPLALGVATLLLLGCTDKVHAQGRQVESLGRYTVGSKLADVRSLTRSKNCLIEGGNADCTFTDSNGVAYVVLKDSVTSVLITEKTTGPSVKLPFGLKFGDNLDVAARKLVSDGRIWTLGADPNVSTGIVLSSSEQYSGNNNWRFNVEIRFESGRLVGISYSSGTI